MTDRDHSNFWVLMIAGIGAGALTGAMLGLMAVRRPRSGKCDEMTDTVDDLKRRAEQILAELSQSYSAPVSETPSSHDKFTEFHKETVI